MSSSTDSGEHEPSKHLSGAIVALGALILAVEPVLWLVGTWTEPAYDSPGGWIFALAGALFCWSFFGGTREEEGAKGGSARSQRAAVWLLIGTAVLRLVGQVLAINVLGALALAVDVYAIGLLCGLSRRKRAVSPFWLAVLFSFSLPVERIFQRLVGYALQHLSAAGSCSLLDLVFDNVSCAGVNIQLAGQQVLVDLPCSGARGLVLLSVLFSGLAAIARPSFRQALVGVGLAMLSALVANSVRIAALAVGIAFPEVVGVDVMAQPWHDVVGLAALGFGVMPLVWWTKHIRSPRHPSPNRGGAERFPRGGGGRKHRPLSRRHQATKSLFKPPSDGFASLRRHLPDAGRSGMAVVFLIAALAILFAPQKPIDIARSLDPLSLPTTLGGHPATAQPLSALEEDYFTRFGGAAAKASYGPHTLLVVRTSAPLRHLHAPDECLSGAGFAVETAGVSGSALPGATYRATAPDGSRWRVVVTYVSDSGDVATSVSEAVWKWMQNTGSTWTAIERIHPAHAPLEQAEAFDANVARAFDLGRDYAPHQLN